MATTITVSDRVQASTPVFGLPVDEARVDPVVEATNRATTIREALMKGQIVDRNLTAPPGVAPADGTIYLVATGGTGPWASKDGKLAIADNREPGGWVFVDLWAGATFWVVDEATALTWNGSAWVSDDGSSSLPLAGGTMSGSIAMGGNSLTGLAAGSAGTPAISPAEDATDGVFFAAGQVSIATSGSERFRMTDNIAYVFPTTVAMGASGLASIKQLSNYLELAGHSSYLGAKVHAGGTEVARFTAAGLGQLPAGSAAAPAISPAEDATDGIYFASDQVNVSVGGAQRLRIASTNVYVLPSSINLGASGDTTLSFPSGGKINVGGTEVARFTTAGLGQLPAGSAAAPSISPAEDATDGLYFAAGKVGISTSATERVAVTDTFFKSTVQIQCNIIKDVNSTDFLAMANAGNLYLGSNNSGSGPVDDIFMAPGGGLHVGGLTAEASALVSMTSTTKGFLPPRITTTQRDAISTPATGLVIYNTTDNVLNFYNGSTWGAV